MARKKHEDEAEAGAARPFAHKVRESASQIWLAGLGAFAKAQEEGNKVFDTLVREGQNIQRKTQANAEEKFTEASDRMASMASGLSSRATGQWDKLEHIFEDRVAAVLKRLGVPSARDMAALEARVEALERELNRRSATPGQGSRKPAHPADEP